MFSDELVKQAKELNEIELIQILKPSILERYGKQHWKGTMPMAIFSHASDLLTEMQMEIDTPEYRKIHIACIKIFADLTGDYVRELETKLTPA